jgi:hypothetical protein
MAFSEVGIPTRKILNMDQVKVFPAPTVKRVIHFRGGVRAFVRTLPSRKGVTVKFTVTADGILLPPFIIFSSNDKKKWGKVVWDPHLRVWYTWQRNAWTDGTTMRNWILKVLAPYVGDTSSLLVIDHAKPHLREEVLAQLRNMDVHVALVPKTATALVQPLDVSINKVFRTGYNSRYQSEVTERLITHNSLSTIFATFAGCIRL